VVSGSNPLAPTIPLFGSPQFTLLDVSLEDCLNPASLGEVTVYHAGERQHPGSFSVHDQKRLDSGWSLS
jgi:hypothetical protein